MELAQWRKGMNSVLNDMQRVGRTQRSKTGSEYALSSLRSDSQRFLNEITFRDFEGQFGAFYARIGASDFACLRMFLFLYAQKLKQDYIKDAEKLIAQTPLNHRGAKLFIKHIVSIDFKYASPDKRQDEARPESLGIPDRIQWKVKSVVRYGRSTRTVTKRIAQKGSDEFKYARQSFTEAGSAEKDLIMKYEERFCVIRKMLSVIAAANMSLRALDYSLARLHELEQK